jgi:hypothetical protein
MLLILQIALGVALAPVLVLIAVYSAAFLVDWWRVIKPAAIVVLCWIVAGLVIVGIGHQ